MIEVWNTIKECKRYSVSNLGRVRNEHTGRILKPRNNGSGYMKVILCDSGVRINRNIHRLVAITFIPNPESKRCVNHIDGDKSNNCVTNLEWVTHSENNYHAFANGLMTPQDQKGESNRQSKLTKSTVRAIRNDHVAGMTYKELALKYNICRQHVSLIITRKVWDYESV